MYSSPRWCSCDVREGSSHLAGHDCVRADGLVGAAVHQPVVSSPRAAVTASSHRTTRTSPSFAIATPLGTTTRFSSPI